MSYDHRTCPMIVGHGAYVFQDFGLNLASSWHERFSRFRAQTCNHMAQKFFKISCATLSCLIMSCHVMSCHVLSWLVMSCHVLSCLVVSRRVLSGLTFCTWNFGRAECECREGLVSTFVFMASTFVPSTSFNVIEQRELVQLSCSYLVPVRPWLQIVLYVNGLAGAFDVNAETDVFQLLRSWLVPFCVRLCLTWRMRRSYFNLSLHS